MNFRCTLIMMPSTLLRARDRRRLFPCARARSFAKRLRSIFHENHLFESTIVRCALVVPQLLYMRKYLFSTVPIPKPEFPTSQSRVHCAFATARMATDLQVRGEFADGQPLSTVAQGLRPGATLMDLRLAIAKACRHPSMLIRFFWCSRPDFSSSPVAGREIADILATLESLNLNGYIYVKLGW